VLITEKKWITEDSINFPIGSNNFDDYVSVEGMNRCYAKLIEY
jgi:hypothetical protein